MTPGIASHIDVTPAQGTGRRVISGPGFGNRHSAYPQPGAVVDPLDISLR